VMHIADRFTVILDANVLYPFRVRDVLLQFYRQGLYRARWTDQIIDEWTRSVLDRKPHITDSIASQVATMRATFPESWVTGHEPLIPSLVLPDPDDRHVLAAAIKAGAHHIVTENLKDFPAAILDDFDLEAVTADQFLMQTFDLYPVGATSALKMVRGKYANPPFTPPEFITDLAASGLPMLASYARDFINHL